MHRHLSDKYRVRKTVAGIKRQRLVGKQPKSISNANKHWMRLAGGRRLATKHLVASGFRQLRVAHVLFNNDLMSIRNGAGYLARNAQIIREPMGPDNNSHLLTGRNLRSLLTEEGVRLAPMSLVLGMGESVNKSGHAWFTRGFAQMFVSEYFFCLAVLKLLGAEQRKRPNSIPTLHLGNRRV